MAEDGSAITSAQIKHGIERTFADSLSGGLGYHKALLAGTKGYTGPYQGKHLASVETPDARTIVFHLTKPYGDWPWIASTPAFSPVPAGDNPATYTRKPVASGPYRVAEYKQGVSPPSSAIRGGAPPPTRSAPPFPTPSSSRWARTSQSPPSG